MDFTCCFECENRRPACQDECEKYTTVKADMEARRAKEREAREKSRTNSEYIRDHYRRYESRGRK